MAYELGRKAGDIMRLSSRIAFRISEVAEQKWKRGKYLFAAKLYRMATAMVLHDVSLMRELLKQIEEAK